MKLITGHFEETVGCRAYYRMFREKDKSSGRDKGGLRRSRHGKLKRRD